MLNTFVKYSYNKKLKKLLGRGLGTGKGKTSGRGTKGQKSRSGIAVNSFEGGQTPFFRQLPKRGQRKKNETITKVISFSQILYFLYKIKFISNIRFSDIKNTLSLNSKKKNIQLLGNPKINFQLNIEVNFISKKNLTQFCNHGFIITIL